MPEDVNVWRAHQVGKSEKNLIQAYTERYTPPEIYESNKEDEKESESYGPSYPGYTAVEGVYSGFDIYTFGMSFYELMLTKSTEQIIYEKEKYRRQTTPKEEYLEFLAEVRRIRLLDDPDDEISSKVRELLLMCLDYYPWKRPSFAALNKMFKEMMATPGTFQQNQDALFNKPGIYSMADHIINITSNLYLVDVSTYAAFLLARKISSDPDLRELLLYNRTIDGVGAELVLKSLDGYKHLVTLNMSKDFATGR